MPQPFWKIMEHWENFSIEDIVEEINGKIYVEEWKWIDNYFGYYMISNFGRVKSFLKSKLGRIRKGVPTDGYLQLQLQVDKVFETKKIHRLVAKHFIENPDNLPEVNHKFGNRKDNRFLFLEWSTASDNMKHAYRILGKPNNLSNQKGEGHYKSKFKESDIIEMRRMFESGKYTQKQIAEKYNEKSGSISRILTRKRWKHI